MNYEVFRDGIEIELTDEQIALIQEIFGTDSQAILTNKKSAELSGLSFLVKDYQRGYRWTKSEVQELLDDISALSPQEDGYCMQPLVVAKLSEPGVEARKKLDKNGLSDNSDALPAGIYELLDGQQRLTTIWLISSYLNNGSGGEYSIFYEMARGVDNYYMQQANNAIREWFDRNAGEKDEFPSKLNKLFFIWYEVTDKELSAEKVFKSINEGKIELTNAELFKALLLNPDNVSVEDQNKLQQIAFEWDKIENGLRDDDFWYFISQDDVEKTSQRTRIDYVVEVFARELNQSENLGLSPDKDRFSFLAIQKHLERQEHERIIGFEDIRDVWEQIVGVYDKLFSWYKDEELYHTIGYLVASEEKNRGSKAVVSEIVSLIYQETRNKTVDETKKTVRKKIKEQIIIKDSSGKDISVDNIMYEYKPGEKELVSKSTLRKILLFTNIYSLIFYRKPAVNDSVAFTRFPFRQYNQIKAWDIEHISPRTVEKDIENACSCFEEFQSNIQSLIDDLEEGDTRTKKLEEYFQKKPDDSNYKTESGYNDCCILWKEYADELSQVPDNNISNLVLLNSSINRSYGNAFFNRKRNVIIENDKRGIFVPVCTKNVFMKYYSDSVANPTQWTDNDKAKYKEFIEEMFRDVKEW